MAPRSAVRQSLRISKCPGLPAALNSARKRLTVKSSNVNAHCWSKVSSVAMEAGSAARRLSAKAVSNGTGVCPPPRRTVPGGLDRRRAEQHVRRDEGTGEEQVPTSDLSGTSAASGLRCGTGPHCRIPRGWRLRGDRLQRRLLARYAASGDVVGATRGQTRSEPRP